MGSLIVSLALLTAVGVSSANASTISQPASGTLVPENRTLFFDWAWSEDQYASRLLLSRAPNPSDPSWQKMDAIASGQERLYSSNFTLRNLSEVGLGTWYWRLCSYRFGGEDDKCYLEPEIRAFTILDVIDCADGVDNDNDGKTDLGDAGCRNARGTTEVTTLAPSRVRPLAKAALKDDNSGRLLGLRLRCGKPTGVRASCRYRFYQHGSRRMPSYSSRGAVNLALQEGVRAIRPAYSLRERVSIRGKCKRWQAFKCRYRRNARGRL